MPEPSFDVVWPLSPKAKAADALPDRLDTLDGKVIAELWNHMYSGDRAYPLLREELRRRYPTVQFVHYEEFGNFHGADELAVVARLPELLRERGADAAISAVGH